VCGSAITRQAYRQQVGGSAAHGFWRLLERTWAAFPQIGVTSFDGDPIAGQRHQHSQHTNAFVTISKRMIADDAERQPGRLHISWSLNPAS